MKKSMLRSASPLRSRGKKVVKKVVKKVIKKKSLCGCDSGKKWNDCCGRCTCPC